MNSPLAMDLKSKPSNNTNNSNINTINSNSHSNSTATASGDIKCAQIKSKKLFPQKLWDLINDERFHFCLRWSDDGQLVYLNREAFEGSYLKTDENQFHTQKAISFVRQMNMYGFRKVDDCYYENDNFKRGCEHLLKNMIRKHPTKSNNNNGSNRDSILFNHKDTPTCSSNLSMDNLSRASSNQDQETINNDNINYDAFYSLLSSTINNDLYQQAAAAALRAAIAASPSPISQQQPLHQQQLQLPIQLQQTPSDLALDVDRLSNLQQFYHQMSLLMCALLYNVS